MEPATQLQSEIKLRTQQCIQNMDEYLDKSYHRIQNAIDSLELDVCLQPKQVNEPSKAKLQHFPQPPQMTIEINLHLTPQDLQSIRPIYKQVEEQEEVYQWKEDLFDIFSYLKDVDRQIFNGIIEILKKEKVSDSLGFLSKGEQIGDVKKKYFKGIANALKKIHQHDFNINDYSTEIKQEARENLITIIKIQQSNYQQFHLFIYISFILYSERIKYCKVVWISQQELNDKLQSIPNIYQFLSSNKYHYQQKHTNQLENNKLRS